MKVTSCCNFLSSLLRKEKKIYPELANSENIADNPEKAAENFVTSKEFLSARLKNFAIKLHNVEIQPHETTQTGLDYALYYYDLENLRKYKEDLVQDISKELENDGSIENIYTKVTKIVDDAALKCRNISKDSVFKFGTEDNGKENIAEFYEKILAELSKFEGKDKVNEGENKLNNFLRGSKVLDHITNPNQKAQKRFSFFGRLPESGEKMVR